MFLLVLRQLRRRPMPAGELLRRSGASRGALFVAVDALEAEGLVERDEASVYRPTRAGIEALLARVADQTPAAEQVTVLFTDIVGSTDLLERLGDEAAHRLRRRHFALLRGVVADHGGRVVKSLGDGLMVAFADASAGLACARTMQLSLVAAADPLELRIGIASGEVAREDDDVFGRPVIIARRLCDAAGAGEVLVACPPTATAPPCELERVRPLRLKGFRAPVAAGAMRLGPHAVAA
jgi:class 3 adenylate cyclase